MNPSVPSRQTRQRLIARYLADIEDALTPDRLASYRPAGGNDLETIATYFWNIALARDLYPSLCAAEVSIRNGIHRSLTQYASSPYWFDKIELLPNEKRSVEAVKEGIRKSGKPTIPGRVVAGLSFGFWTGILSKGYGPHGYGASIWSPNNAALIRHAFPHLQAQNQYRGFVHLHLNDLRLLRNRTVHHEPIWRGMTVRRQNQTTTLELGDLHRSAIDIIGWTSPHLRDSTIAFDRFTDTLLHGQQQHLARVSALLGM